MKVVTSKEMARLEKLAFDRGESGEAFMERVGLEIASMIPQFYSSTHPMILLCGRGNNAGDAYVAGRFLLQRGYNVEALQLFPLESCSELCKKNAKAFQECGGEIVFHNYKFPKNGVLLDGILGTGFKGKLEEHLADAIERANSSGNPIFAIDIPSGLDGNTGEVQNVAIKAEATFFLGVAKTGFFLEDGPRYTGRLYPISFGMENDIAQLGLASFWMLDENEVVQFLPKMVRTQHKYQKGYVVGLTGSHGMPGAAILSSEAAMRGGAGIVRILVPSGMENETANLPPELLRYFYQNNEWKKLTTFMNEATSAYLGPGIGRESTTKKLVKELLTAIQKPCVIDADALNIIAEDHSIRIPKGAILTPHHGEMARLLQSPREDKLTDALIAKCQEFSEKHEAILVLKGMPTLIFSPGTTPYLSAKGDPGMATAGCGDVLTGIIAAFLSQKLSPLHAASIGVVLHGIAGEIASAKATSYSLIARDIIEAIPGAFKSISSKNP